MTRAPENPEPGCVLGTGIDLVEIERMKKTLGKWGERFRNYVFLPGEQQYCESKAEPWRHYAGRFAVKEAVSKAFGTGVGEHISWLDIEVLRDPQSGAPHVRLGEKGRKLAAARGVHRVLASLSHTHSHAVAHALLVGGSGRPGVIKQ